MPGLPGLVEPIVVAPVHVAHGSREQLRGRQIVEGRERDGDVVAADLLDMAVRVHPHTAVLAKDGGVVAPRTEAIFTGALLAGEQAERAGLDPHRPAPHFPAVAAVALAGPLREVEIRFEAEFSAVTAPVIGLLGHGELMPRPRPPVEPPDV